MTPSQATARLFHRAADLLRLTDRQRHALLTPTRELQVECGIHRDDGTLATFVGYRVQHTTAAGR